MFLTSSIFAQLSVTTCPQVDKLNNGNGQAASSAGIFPGYGQNNTVATNVVGTSYQTVNFDPAAKTGNYILKWPSATLLTNIPVVTRVWITNSSGVTTLSNVVFGPPPPPYLSGGYNYVNYSFYVQNLPNAGKVSVEFSDPTTGSPAFNCTFDLATGTSTTPPVYSCTPTVSTPPTSQILCDNGSVTFTASTLGATTYKWQYSSNSGSTWTDITQTGNFTSVSLSSLTVANRLTYTGYQFRIAVTNSCGTTNSTAATLTVNPMPTAVFAGSTSVCGLNQTRSIGVTLTGTAPWTINYTVNGVATSISNITASPYYFSVTPAVTTTYILTSVTDANCYDNTLTGSTTLSVYAQPTVTPSNASACLGSSTFSLTYSSTNSPNQYSIATGTRALSGFIAVSNAALTATPLSVTIPASGNAAGTYDFTMTVRNSTSGCSSSGTFTLTLNALPVVTASASSYSVCSGGTSTLTAVGASTYTWSPATYLSGTTGSSVTANPTATTTYTATGTNAAGCTSTSSVTITATSTFSVSISASTATTCSGGQATLTASGGNTYSWSGPSSYSATGNPVVVTPSATGTYTVTGTDINGCTATATQTITVGGGPTVTVSSNVTICYGSSTTLTASGATTYAWTPSTTLSASTGTSVTATPTTTTTYTVYGTTSGCTNTASVTVTVTASPVTSVPNQVVYCANDYSTGNKTLDVSITASSSQTFSWSGSVDNIVAYASITGNGQYSLASSNGGAKSTISIKTPSAGYQYYKVAFTSGSCAFTYQITLKELPSSLSDISSAQTICSGTSPSTLTYLGTTNASSTTTTYSTNWQSSPDGTINSFTDISGATSTTYSPSTLTADTWYRIKITATGGNCAGFNYSNNIKITIATAITNNTISLTDACTGGTGIVGSTPTGGTGSYTYKWQSSTTSSSVGFSDVVNATSQSYTPLIPSVTTWYKRLVSSGSCTNSESNVIVVYPPITSTQISNGQTVCSGVSLTALSTSPSGGPTGSSFTYLWYSSTDNASFTSIDSTRSQCKPYTTVGTKYYKVLITKGSCSSYSNTAKIIVNALPTVTVTPSSATVCSGSTSTLTASGATSYSWSPITDLDVSTGSTVVSTLTATRTYTVTGTNTTGCTSTATSTITYSASPSTPTVSAGSSTICSTAAPFNLTTLITSGGTNEWYSVPNNSVTYKLASTSVSSSGTYYVYSKSGSCYSSSYASYALTINDVTAPVTSASSVSVCSPTTVNLTSIEPSATSGTTLNWFSDNTHTTAVATPTSVSSGTYYLFAYSTAGACYGTAYDTVTVTINTLPTVSVSSGTLSTCNPGTIDLTSTRSATAGITYRWYTTNTSPPSAANLIAQPTIMGSSGTYYVFAFDNTTNCISTSPASVVATINPIPTLVLTSPSTKCDNNSTSVTVTASGVSSPTYQWLIYNQATDAWDNASNTGVYTGATTATLNISSNHLLDGSAYKCLVTSSGCYDYSDIGVLGVSSPTAPTVSVTQPTCSTATGSAEVTSYNGSLTFSLDGGAYQSSTTFNSITQNSNHSIVAKVDVLGCLSSATNFTINAQPTLPTTANAGADQINNGSCSTNSINLSANAPSTGTGAWSIISGIGGSFGSSTSNTSTFTGSYNTSYTLRWTTTIGACTSTDEMLVKICNSVVSLPIELIDFTVTKSGEINLLEWTTASEKNNDYFTLEKTKDGIQYDVIGVQSGAGNSTETINYSFTDRDVAKIINYYRLKQTDFDGKCIYSDLISMDNSFKNKEIKSIRNLLGQEVQINYHGIVIIFYQDGTSIKMIQ